MGNDVQVASNQSFNDFKEKLSEKIRDDIGSLLPDEAITGLIEQAVQKSFFEDRVERHGYGSPTHKPSWFVQAVADAAKPMLQKQVEYWVKENEDVLKKALADFLKEEGLLLMAMAQMQQSLSNQTFQAIEDILTRIRNNGGY